MHMYHLNTQGSGEFNIRLVYQLLLIVLNTVLTIGTKLSGNCIHRNFDKWNRQCHDLREIGNKCLSCEAIKAQCVPHLKTRRHNLPKKGWQRSECFADAAVCVVPEAAGQRISFRPL